MFPVISQSDPEFDPGGVGGRAKDDDPCPVIIINPEGDKRDGDLVEVVFEFRRAANVIFLDTEGDIIIPLPIVPCLLQLNVPPDKSTIKQFSSNNCSINCFMVRMAWIDLCQRTII